MSADRLFESGAEAKAALRLDLAAALFAKAVALRPSFVQARVNLGNVLTRLGRAEEALQQYAFVLDQAPTYALAHMNRGVALTALNRHADSLKAYDQALRIAPDFYEARYRKALQLLRLGDFDQGWPLHEARWNCRSHAGRPYADRAYWTGEEDIADETLLVHAEQGLGDTLQFCRYLPLLAARGADVWLHVAPSLAPLLSDLPGVLGLVREGDALPAFDRHVSLMSLPLAFRTTPGTIPAAAAYLQAPEARVRFWAERFPRTGRLRVGLAWSGDPGHHDDHNRSIPLAIVAALAGPGIELVCLQTQLREGDARLMTRAGVACFGREIMDFGDTAALAAGCDVVISADTSVAHLAGALGRPTWILLPFCGDWRWMTAPARSPWYPTARLFRQDRTGDWTGVMDRVGAALTAFAGNPGMSSC